MPPALSPQPSALGSSSISVTLADLIAMRQHARREEHAASKRVAGSRAAAHASKLRGRGNIP